MSLRPRIKPKSSAFDQMLEALGWILLVIFWCYILSSYDSLPETIPTHFNLSGQADGFGKRSSIFLLPAITSALFFGLTLLNRFPHVFNYPVEINETNAEHQYRLATRLLRWLKTWIVILFLLVSISGITEAYATRSNMIAWTLPLGMLGLLIGLIVYLVAAAKQS
jgi:uncharacterized membrane protein